MNFTDEQRAKLIAHNVEVNESKVTGVEHRDGYLTHVITDRGQVQRDTVYFRAPFEQHSAIPAELGCEFTEQGYLRVDATQKTTIDGGMPRVITHRRCGPLPMRSVQETWQAPR